MIVLKGRKISGGMAEGEALVIKEPLSFRIVDTKTGIVVEKGHELEGVSLKNKILVFPHGKGSCGGDRFIYDMSRRRTAPKAIINIRADPIIIVGAILGNIPMVDKPDRNPLDVINTGDHVRVNADEALIEVTKNAEKACTS